MIEQTTKISIGVDVVEESNSMSQSQFLFLYPPIQIHIYNLAMVNIEEIKYNVWNIQPK